MRREIIAPVIVCGALLCGIACRRSSEVYLEQGNRSFRSGKYADAVLQYQKAIQKKPNLGEAYYRLGLAEIERHNAKDALGALSRAVELLPDSVEAKVKLADLSLAVFLADPKSPKPFYDRVDKLSAELLAKAPNSFDGLRLKGALALADRKLPDAIDYLQRANQAKPMNREVVLGLSQALWLSGSPEGERLALALLDKEKDFGAIYDALYRHYLQTNRRAEAERILEAKARNNPRVPEYALELAGHYSRSNKPSEMNAALQRLLENPKDFPNGRLLVGDFYGRLGRWAEALRHFEEGLRTAGADKAVYQKRIAGALAALGRREEAIRQVEQALRTNAADRQGRAMRADLLLNGDKPEDWQAAAREYEALAKEQPQDALSLLNSGRALLKSGKREDARAQLLNAARLRKDLVLPRLLLATLSLQEAKSAEAVRYAEEALLVNPDHAGAKFLRAAGLTGQGRYAEARGELTRLAAVYPDSPDVLLQLGVVAVAEKKYTEAQRLFAKVSGVGGGDPRAALGLVEVYTAQQQFEAALRFLESELKKAPESAYLRRLLASAASTAGQHDRAISEYRALLRKEPKAADLQMGLGRAYRAKGDYPQAIDAFRGAIAAAPEKAETVMALAETLYMAGSLAEAKAAFQRALKMQPASADAMNNVAYLTCETGGNLDEALKLAQQAVQKFPGNAAFIDTLGWVYLKKGDAQTAARVFESAVHKDAQQTAFRHHLALALLKGGDRGRAKSELEIALGAKPPKAEEEKMRELLRSIQ